jgi:small neutral amino acid transporter SnatA (MarC family)
MFYLTTLSIGNITFLQLQWRKNTTRALSSGEMVLARENPKYSDRNLSQETEVLLQNPVAVPISSPQFLHVIVVSSASRRRFDRPATNSTTMALSLHIAIFVFFSRFCFRYYMSQMINENVK